MKKETELKEGQSLLTEVPSDEAGKLLTEIIPDEVKKEEELLTEEKDTSAKKSAKAPRVKKSKRELQPKKEAPPAVIEAIEKIAAIELAKEEAEKTKGPDLSEDRIKLLGFPLRAGLSLEEPPIVVEAVEPPVVDISTPPGPFFPEDEQTPIVVEAVEPPVVDISTPPGPFFPEDEQTPIVVEAVEPPGPFVPEDETPCETRARRGFRFVKKKVEEYTPSERKSLLKNFSRRTLRTRYGIEF